MVQADAISEHQLARDDLYPERILLTALLRIGLDNEATRFF